MNNKVALKNKAKNRSMDFVPSETLPAHCMWWLCVCMQYNYHLITADEHRVILIKEGDYIHASHVNVSQ